LYIDYRRYSCEYQHCMMIRCKSFWLAVFRRLETSEDRYIAIVVRASNVMLGLYF